MSAAHDLTGNHFGSLTVLCDSGKTQCGHKLWTCVCDCGNRTEVTTGNLKQGRSTRCPKCGHKHAAKVSFLDLSGKKFGRLTPIRVVSKDKDKNLWECRCDCGNTSVVATEALTSGNTKSCGCYKADEFKQRVTKHGMKHTKIYGTWLNMKNRCNNPRCKAYPYYGGRGIKVCDDWNNRFESFLRDMREPSDNSLSIDRIDPDGNYEPSNCRWATEYTQQHNKRNTIRITIDGKEDTVDKWALVSPVLSGTIRARLKKGASGYDAVFAPKFHRARR